MTKQKGGKVLGQGSYGCVISPPILCSSKINKLNKVSKLINLTNASKAEYDEAINEYKSGEIFKKVDPNNMYFLPGIDLCEITDKDKNITKQNQKDIEKCGFKDNKQTFLLNILMKKGDDFPKITKELNETNFLKSLAYVLNGANKSIYDLNICLLDIKGDNILYSKDDDSEEIYPVFIDFSDNFVIKSGDEFINFIRDFSPQLPYYPTWGLEISILFLDYFIDNYYRNTKKYNKKRQNFYQEIWDYKKIDFTVENGKNMYKNILDYINKEIKTKRGFLGFFNKIMIYSIGVSYYESFMKSKIKNNKYINDLLLSMMRENIIYRPYINDILSLIKSKIKYKTREDLLISLKDEKKKKQIKRKVKKSLKVKELFDKLVESKKKSPPLPSGLILSRLTPLSQLSFKSRPHVSLSIRAPPGLKKISKKISKKPSKKTYKNPFRSKSPKKSSKKPSKNVSNNCMKMKVKEIKKTKEYKNLKVKGKYKLKKKELCAILQKQTGVDYSSKTKAELLKIIKDKINC